MTHARLRDDVSIAADRSSHQQARDIADGKRGADHAAGPAALQQEHADERSDPRLHVGHEEVDGQQRPQAGRTGFILVRTFLRHRPSPESCPYYLRMIFPENRFTFFRIMR
jgi:hypothetical protein